MSAASKACQQLQAPVFFFNLLQLMRQKGLVRAAGHIEGPVLQ
jgi:hypothetical protein